jgi:hypothetical protein
MDKRGQKFDGQPAFALVMQKSKVSYYVEPVGPLGYLSCAGGLTPPVPAGPPRDPNAEAGH